LTNHARERAQVRGVSMRIVEAIYANADLCPFVGSGCRSLMVSRRKLDRLADSIPAADRERMDGVVLVVDPDGEAIITVLHAHSPRGRHRSRSISTSRRPGLRPTWAVTSGPKDEQPLADGKKPAGRPGGSSKEGSMLTASRSSSRFAAISPVRIAPPPAVRLNSKVA
jgi:hypothetical protein